MTDERREQLDSPSIDHEIEARRNDADFMDRLRRRHKQERELSEHLAR